MPRSDLGVLGVTPERRALAEKARTLRSDGLTYQKIAETLGISRSYANALITDPDGVKARAIKDSYAQPCPRCGKPMSGCNGVSGAPLLCANCTPHVKTWTQNEILAVFTQFFHEFGRPPRAGDYVGRHPSQRHRNSPTRIAEINEAVEFKLPRPAAVQREFGSWREGLKAAGLEPSNGGNPAHREHGLGRNQKKILAGLSAGPKRVRELAVECNVTPCSAQSAVGSLSRLGLIERVQYGIYRISDVSDPQRRLVMAREFVVLSRNGTGWVPRETVEAPTAALAIEKVADGEGSFVAVPTNYWNEFKVGTVTKLAVIQEPASA